MTALTIAETAIRLDAQGRYCLNDLHLAAGAIGHHRPSKWLATKQAQGLISALQASEVKPEFGLYSGPTPSPNSGLVEPLNTDKPETGKPATFVVKELVYAYAMWISPAFHLKVIRAIDAADTLGLQGVLNDAVGALLKFHAGQYSAEETLAALTAGMEALAWQRANVERHATPQLELDP